jgi:uncharacterized protein (TIGR04255 family)
MPGVQQRLEGLGFVICDTSHEVLLSWTPGSPAHNYESPRWDFLTAERRTGVVVNEQMVLLHTNAYDTYETFSAVLQPVVEAVAAETGLRVTRRLGLRYVDRVTVEPGESFEQYVAAPMLGFPSNEAAKLGATKATARSETLLQTPAGTLAVRSVFGPGVFLPPDLVPTPLAYAPLEASPPALAMDFDHFRVQEEPFDLAQVMQRLERLHDAVDIVFRQIVTPHALKQWGQELVP